MNPFQPSYKIVHLKKLVIESGVRFSIGCILDHVQCHLVAKNDDFDGKMSIFWLRYNLFMLLLHTMGLVCKGIFILPFGLILNMVPCNPKDWNRLCMKRNMQKSPNVCYAEAANSGTMYSICIIGREQFPLLQKCIFLTTFSTI